MKKQKLTLNNLKVQSFVTDFNSKKSNTVKGGAQNVENGNTCTNCGPAGCTFACPISYNPEDPCGHTKRHGSYTPAPCYC